MSRVFIQYFSGQNNIQLLVKTDKELKKIVEKSAKIREKT